MSLSAPLAPDPQTRAAERARLRLLMHGALVAVIGLLSGFGFVFVILQALTVWPVSLPLDAPFPGSERGWRVAHVAGVMNGMLIMLAGFALPHLRASLRAQRWIVGGMIYTGWGNTVFFHCANFSSNRGLTAGPSRFGEADWPGIIGYLVGGSTIPFTITALLLIALAAARRLREV
ncbi:hypothetical protein SAMN04488038_10778 [Solimonas aquatica]|uniref:Styrene-oxide isomerase n=1 Tax=Solimonas aquatica TaxID=489703 RepID=A0A1H9GHJ3_9GAMM|nr:hypothetical protein [Solimonas aquatica]SEQ49582.1 hypothetical protein SAMN04488038_10778 [Solimonas aquatica]